MSSKEIVLGTRLTTYRCPYGHSFEKPRYGCCPVCGAAVAVSISQSARVANRRAMNLVVQSPRVKADMEAAVIGALCRNSPHFHLVAIVAYHTPKTRIEALPVVGKLLYRVRCEGIVREIKTRFFPTGDLSLH